MLETMSPDEDGDPSLARASASAKDLACAAVKLIPDRDLNPDALGKPRRMKVLDMEEGGDQAVCVALNSDNLPGHNQLRSRGA